MTVTLLRGRTALLEMNAATSRPDPKRTCLQFRGRPCGGYGFSLEGLYPTVTRPVGFIANPRIGGGSVLIRGGHLPPATSQLRCIRRVRFLSCARVREGVVTNE